MRRYLCKINAAITPSLAAAGLLLKVEIDAVAVDAVRAAQGFRPATVRRSTSRLLRRDRGLMGDSFKRTMRLDRNGARLRCEVGVHPHTVRWRAVG